MPAPAGLEEVAARRGIRLTAAERGPVLALAAELLGGEPAEVTGSPAPRTCGGFATAGPDDPWGAVVRWCDVAPTGEGPLSGRNVSVKDSIAVGGVPMSAGLPALADHVPLHDSAVVRRLRAAGARIVAVTNMDGLGMAAGGETSGYGVTRNPHDPTRTAGGSSSGAAAGLFSPAIDVAVGTDQGGSARVPASWCGVLGLKPTRGLVPYAGNAGIHPVLDHVGPLARTTADLAAAVDALTATRRAGAAVRGAGADLPGLRVGLLAEADPRDPAVAEVVRATAERLTLLGARVSDVSVPRHLSVGGPSGRLNCLGMAELLDGRTAGPAGRAFSRALGEAAADDATVLSPHVKAAWLAGMVLLRDRRRVLAGARSAVRSAAAAYDDSLREVDVLLLATTPHPAFEPPFDGDPSGLLARGWDMLAHTEPFNLTGHPALSLPVGAVAGPRGPLPVGVSVVGRHCAEELLLRVAAAFERAYGWVADPA